MLRRKLRLKMDNLKKLRVKPVATWCTSCSHMARAKTSRIRITSSQSKILPSRRRKISRMRIALCAIPLIIGQRNAQTARKKTSTRVEDYEHHQR
jgi:hypothetical protein